MGIYKYETHMHTSQSSACGLNTGKEMVRMYKERGYAGIIVSDHFFNGNTAIRRNMSWKKRIDAFMKGYEEAKAEGDRIGIDVFFAFECTYMGTDLLAYGLDKGFLLKYENLDRYTAEDFIDIVHENGGYIIHAHPFREADYIPSIVLFGKLVDAIEVDNYSHIDPSFNEKARAYAQKLDMAMTCGSDAHNVEVTKLGGVGLSYKANSIDDIIKEIKNKNVKLL